MQASILVDRILWPAIKGDAGPVAQSFTAAYSFLASYVATFPVLLWIMDAPWGRFAQPKSAFNVNPNVGWFIMEIVSPVSFYLSLTAHRPFASLSLPTRLLALAFLVHYFNRSTVFVLRQKGKRSPMHLIVPLSAVAFNLANGHQMGVWLAGATSNVSRAGAVPATVLYHPAFVGGMLLWLVGFVGNLAHDEILRNLRGSGKPAYSVPHGLLFDWPFGGISNPNYLTEWLEWTGFAVAATFASGARCPPPLFGMGLAAVTPIEKLICPPWLFLWMELATMLPRALRGHRWYHSKFGDKMPKRRKAIVPGLL